MHREVDLQKGTICHTFLFLCQIQIRTNLKFRLELISKTLTKLHVFVDNVFNVYLSRNFIIVFVNSSKDLATLATKLIGEIVSHLMYPINSHILGFFYVSCWIIHET